MRKKASIAILSILALTLPFRTLLTLQGTSVKVSIGDFIIAASFSLVLVSFFRPVVPRYVIYILGLFVWIPVSLFFADDPDLIAALSEFIKLAGSVAWLIIPYILLKSNTKQKMAIFSVVSIATASGVAFHSIFQRFILFQSRPDSVFVNSNLFSAYLSFNLFLLVYIYCSKEEHRIQPGVFQMIVASTLITAILVSGSRSGLAGPVICAVVFYFYARNSINKTARVTIYALTGGISIVYIILNPALVERLIEPITSGGESGLGKRQRLWTLGIDAWLEESITGIGYGQFEQRFTTEIGLHNTYLIYLVETGIVGLVLFASEVISPVIGSVRHYSKEPTAFIFAAYITFLLIHGIFHGVDNYRTLWFSIGIVAAIVIPE